MARRGTASWAAEHWGKPCTYSRLMKVELAASVVVPVLPGSEPVWLAMAGVMEAYGYTIRKADTGSYNCRPVTGGSAPSLHSWPLAVDVNWTSNPYVRTPTLRPIKWGVETDMPAAMVAEIESITAGGVQALTWGGRWRRIKDAMHWQLNVTPAEVSAGVHSPRPPYGDGIWMEEHMLKRGDSGPAVQLHQMALKAWNPQALPEYGADGDYGAEMEDWVRRYQASAQVQITGTIDGVTSALLLRHVPKGDHEQPAGGSHIHTFTITAQSETDPGGAQ